MNVPVAGGVGAAGHEIRLRGGSGFVSHQGESDDEDDMTSEAVGASRLPTQPGSSATASPRTILNTTGTTSPSDSQCFLVTVATKSQVEQFRCREPRETSAGSGASQGQ